MKVKTIDKTLYGNLTKINFAPNIGEMTPKELKTCFINTLKYYKEREKYLSRKELEYLKQLEEVNIIVYGK